MSKVIKSTTKKANAASSAKGNTVKIIKLHTDQKAAEAHVTRVKARGGTAKMILEQKIIKVESTYRKAKAK
jgi:hypothetical protein